MTREDREQSIADNIAYGRAVQATVTRRFETRPLLVVAGFSQGVAQAYRTAAALGPSCHGVIALGGDLPPDVAPRAANLPPVLVGRGKTDKYYAAAMLTKDIATLRGAGVDLDSCVFDGGHEWADGFVDAARAFLARLDQPAG
jgi:predicted esterase